MLELKRPWRRRGWGCTLSFLPSIWTPLATCPAIGGTGKGHLVRELDALGGEMGRAADACCIQYRMLNRGKGPAVHSLRAQADRRSYQQYMKHVLELQDNLDLKQAMVTELLVTDGAVTGLKTQLGAYYEAKAVILATGTYLDSTIITGSCVLSSGPDGMHPSTGLSDCLKALGLPMRRFKTGTPPRVNRRSVDVSQMELQPGDDVPEPFSFSTTGAVQNQAVCYLTYTNEHTHAIIRDNLDRSPLFDGTIQGVGPRYCPSIETKVVRFPDKERHQLFVEPMGLDTEENPDACGRLGIERVPTLLIIKQGAITAKMAGLMNPKEFCAFYQQSMRTA